MAKRKFEDVEHGADVVDWAELSTKQLQNKLYLATQIVIPGIIMPALKAGDPRAQGVLERWESDRLAIIEELRRRGKLNDVHIVGQPAKMIASKGAI